MAILDTLSATASAAYGLRKLRNAYAGSAIKVRRSSDNTTQDIGFNGSGYLDTTALLAFVGSNNGFIDTWYDQTGNARHATQAATSKQPQIVASGAIYTKGSGGRPVLRFDGSGRSTELGLYQFDATGTSFSASYLWSVDLGTGNTNNCLGTSGTGYNQNGIYVQSDYNNVAFLCGATTAISAATPGGYGSGVPMVALATYGGSGATLLAYLGNTAGSAGNPTWTTGNKTKFLLGAYYDTSGYSTGVSLNGTVGEFISFTSVLSSTDRTALYNDQTTYLSSGGSAPAPNGLKYSFAAGMNLSGGEFNASYSNIAAFDAGDYGKWYGYPSLSDIQLWINRGFPIIRVPIMWSHLLTTDGTTYTWSTHRDGGGVLDIDRIGAVIDQISANGGYCLLDMHSYGYSWPDDGSCSLAAGLIGRQSAATSSFATIWGLIAARFSTKTNLAFGLSNEPHDQTVAEWKIGAQAAIDAIRATGAGQPIFVGTIPWSGAHSFVANGNNSLFSLNDTANNLVFEVHQYIDSDFSGTNYGDGSITSATFSTLLSSLISQARSAGKKLFLGEFGWANTAAQSAKGGELLDVVHANKDVFVGWTYWGAGSLGTGYPLYPVDGGNQLSKLGSYNNQNALNNGTVGATINATLASLGLAATAAARVAGSAVNTLAALTSSAAGAVAASGTLAQTLAAISIAAVGTLGNNVNGILAQTLGQASSAGTATVRVSGSVSSKLSPMTVAGFGTGSGGINLAVHPIVQILVDGSTSAKGDIRAFVRTRMRLIFATIAEMRTYDLAGQVNVEAGGIRFTLDAADTTSADDGRTVIVSNDGKRFKRAETPQIVSPYGATITMIVEEQELTVTGASVLSTSALIRAKDIVLGVSTRVTQAVTGAVSFSTGVSGNASQFGSALAVTFGSTNIGAVAPFVAAADTPVLLTAAGGNFSGGKVRIAIQVLRVTAPQA